MTTCAHEYTFNSSNNLRNKRRKKEQQQHDEETGEEENLLVFMQFHPVHVDVFCLPAVFDVTERVIHRYHVCTLFFARRT